MNLFNIGKIIIIGYVIFISCDKIKPVVSSTNQISFTEVTKYAGLADFRHITGAAADKWDLVVVLSITMETVGQIYY